MKPGVRSTMDLATHSQGRPNRCVVERDTCSPSTHTHALRHSLSNTHTHVSQHALAHTTEDVVHRSHTAAVLLFSDFSRFATLHGPSQCNFCVRLISHWIRAVHCVAVQVTTQGRQGHNACLTQCESLWTRHPSRRYKKITILWHWFVRTGTERTAYRV